MITVWIVATTWCRAHGPEAVWQALDVPFLFLCHRLPERVLSVAGTPLPMCSRCTGIWLGMSLSAALAWPALSLRVLRVVVPLAMLFMLGEVVTQDLGLHPVFHPTRLLSGLLLSIPFGGAIGKLIAVELGGAPAGPAAPPAAATTSAVAPATATPAAVPAEPSTS